jgi:hypothetical protein
VDPAIGTAGASLKSVKTLTPTKAQVEGPTKQLVGFLKDKANPVNQSAARDQLMQAAQGIGPSGPSVAFLEAYTEVLSKELMPLADDANPRTQLLAGIVTAEVAQAAKNPKLMDVAARLMKDKDAAVALWGMKAVKSIIPAVLKNPLLNSTAKQMLDQVIQTVKTHKRGEIVDEAYDAVTLEQGSIPLFNPVKAVNPKGIDLLIDATLSLVDYRTSLYVKDLPEGLAADGKAAGFLAVPAIWSALPEPRKQQAMQAISNLLAVTIQRAKVGAWKDTSGIFVTINTIGSFFEVTAGVPPGPLGLAGASLRRLHQGMGPKALDDAWAAALTELKRTWKVNDPPTVQNIAAPASAPVIGAPGNRSAPVSPTPNTPSGAPANRPGGTGSRGA